MRVISGIAGGRKLQTLGGDDITRPTTDKVKEAVFSIIQFELQDKHFLDLFSGSGQMAIEAVSRGAKSAVVVDNSRQAANIIKENIQKCGFETLIKLHICDSFSYLSRSTEKFDIAYLDPPYHKNFIDKALPLLVPLMNENGIIICEIASDETLPEICGDFSIKKTYKYSNISVVVYKNG